MPRNVRHSPLLPRYILWRTFCNMNVHGHVTDFYFSSVECAVYIHSEQNASQHAISAGAVLENKIGGGTREN